MPGLGSFGLSDMIRCQSDLRRVAAGASTMEEAAQRVVAHLYDYLRDEAGRPSCVLIRLYKTHDYGGLPDDLRDFAAASLRRSEPPEDLRCLTLLSTIGTEETWNDRRLSEGHKAIPLPSSEVVQQSPMIAQMIKQFGLEVETVISPDFEVITDLEQNTYNVFHVPEAADSPYVPAQDFVADNGVRSALGFGGLLPSGELFAVIIFSLETIDKQTAELFQTVALSVKLALLPFADGPVFSS